MWRDDFKAFGLAAGRMELPSTEKTTVGREIGNWIWNVSFEMAIKEVVGYSNL